MNVSKARVYWGKVSWIWVWICAGIFSGEVRNVNGEIADWAKSGRVAGLSLQVTADDNTVESAVLRLKAQNVSIVELDTALSLYWTDEEFEEEINFIRRASQKIHEHGMKVVVYYPALEVVTTDGEVNARSAAKQHPDWLQIGIDGTANVFYGSKEDWVPPQGESAWMSPNSSYREYFIGRVKKLASRAEVDGLWMDVPLYLDTGAPWSDMSPGARVAFESWSLAQGHNGGLGFATPSVADIQNQDFRYWLEWRHLNLAEFIDNVRQEALASNPEWMFVTEVYPMDYMDTLWTGLDGARMINGDGAIKVWEVDSVSNSQGMKWAHIEDMSNRVAMYKYGRGVDRNLPSWGFTYGFEVEDASLGIGAAIATQTIPFETKTPIMTQTVDGEMRAQWYGFIRDHEEALFRQDRLARVGVWFSSSTREYHDFASGGKYGMFLQETAPNPDPDWWAQFDGAGLKKLPHVSSWRGAAYGLHQLGIPYKCVVDPATAVDLQGLEVLWLPSVVCLSEARSREIEAFVEAGGTVIATGLMPGTQDELGNSRSVSSLDQLFGFGGLLTSSQRMVERGQGAAIFRPDIKGSDLFTLEGGNSALAESTLGKVEQLLRIHATEDIVADLPNGIFLDMSTISSALTQHLYILNYSGAQQPMVISPKTILMQYRIPEGYEVVDVRVASPEPSGGNRPLNYAQTGLRHIGFEITVEQFALVTIQLAPAGSPQPGNTAGLVFSSPEVSEAVTAGLRFILETMRNAPGKTEAPYRYGVPTNLKDNNFDTDLYTGGHHVTAEHMGLLLRVTALMKNEQAFQESLEFVEQVLFSKGYHVPGWSMDKNKLSRFLQKDQVDGIDIWAAANAPLDDFRVVRGLLHGYERMGNTQAYKLADEILNGMYWTSVTDRLRGTAEKFTAYPDGLIGYSWDWADQDVPTLSPPARALGIGRLGTFPIPVDYQELETMYMAAMIQPRWKKTLASSVDLLLNSEISGVPGLFYNGLGDNNQFTGDFEFPGERQGNNLKVIQELWIALHLKRVANAPAYVLDVVRRQRSSDAALRSYQFFKNFYIQNGRVPEYMTFAGQDVPECGPTPEGDCLKRGVENLFNGEARIYAQLGRLALLFGDRAFADQLIAEKILTDRVTDPTDPRYGKIGLSTAASDDAEAWNTLEPLLTLCLSALPESDPSGENLPPVALNDSLLIGLNVRKSIPVTTLLANDSDPENQILAVLSVDSQSVQGGQLQLNSSYVIYTPPQGYEGMDSFQYQIVDSIGATAIATVQVELSSLINVPTGITLDGDLVDWPADHLIILDPKDISAPAAKTDLRAIHIHHQDGKLYLAYVNESPIQVNWGFSLFIDVDQNKSTGFQYYEVGADYVINDRTVSRYAGTGNNWSWTYVGDTRLRIAGNTAEMSFPLDGLGTPEVLRLVFEGNNEPYFVVGAVDVVPDSVAGTVAGPRYITYRLIAPEGILEDGNFSDWPANSQVFLDAKESIGLTSGIDLRELRLARDANKYYFGMRNEFPAVMNWGYQILMDTDSNPDTGYKFFSIGADFILYDNGFFRYQGNGSDWNWAFVGNPAAGIEGSLIEYGVPGAWFGNAAPNSMRLVVIGDNAANGGTFVDLIPDGATASDTSEKFLTVSFDIEVPPNAAPVVQADNVTIDFGQTVRIDVLQNDRDIDGALSPQSVEIVSAPTSGQATVMTSDGSVVYVHDSSTTGIIRFTYRVADDKGLYSAPATVTISVNPPVSTGPYHPVASRTIDGLLDEWNDVPPIGQDPRDATDPGDQLDWKTLFLAHNADSLFIAYESYLPIALNWGHNLYVDTDLSTTTGFQYGGIGADYLIQQGSLYRYAGNGQSWGWTFLQSATQVVSGNVVEMAIPRSALQNPVALRVIWYGENFAYANGKTLDLFPEAGQSARYNFSAPGQNLPPVGVATTVTTLRGRDVEIALLASDPESTPLTYAVVTGPAHGSLSGTAPNLVYSPGADYVGEDSFSWVASDGSLSSDAVNVTITILPQPDAGYPSHLLNTHLIDGNLNEWGNIPVIDTDPADTSADGSQTPMLDWREVRFANDADSLFIAARTESITPLNWSYNLFLDTDINGTTGFRGFGDNLGIGADYLIQGQFLFRYSGVTGTDWSWEFLSSVTHASIGTTHEWKLLLPLIGTPQKIHMSLVADNNAFGAGLPYDYFPDLSATTSAQSYLRYQLAMANPAAPQAGNQPAVDIRREQPFVIQLVPDIPVAQADGIATTIQTQVLLKLFLMAIPGDVWSVQTSHDLEEWSSLGYIDIHGYQKLWAPPSLDKALPTFFRAVKEPTDFSEEL